MNGAPVLKQLDKLSIPQAAEYRVTCHTRRAGFHSSVDLQGSAGRLEALLNEGVAEAQFAALVCHPHPLGGGSMHNKVVYHAMKVLNGREWGFGMPVLRFNFRGVGRSDGAHDGAAEAADVEAALDWLENEFRLPVVAAGFSFGAAMLLNACCRKGRIHGNTHALALLGLPIHGAGREYSHSSLGACTIPKLFLSGDRDQFAPIGRLEELAATAAGPASMVRVRDADHFFSGRIEAMQQALAAWLEEQTR